MTYSSCYESVTEFVHQATEMLDGYTLNTDVYYTLGDICFEIDEFVKGLELRFIDLSVLEHSGELSIHIGCNDVEFMNGRSDPFFTLIQKLSAFSFSKAGPDCLRITLSIGRMWVREAESE